MKLSRLPLLAALVAVAGCAHRGPMATRNDEERVEAGVVTRLENQSLVVRTAEEEPVAMPFDLSEDPTVLFDHTNVGIGALIEGTSVRVFYREEGDLPASVERLEIVTGEEGASIRKRAARPGPRPTSEEEEILAPRRTPAEEPSGPGGVP